MFGTSVILRLQSLVYSFGDKYISVIPPMNGISFYRRAKSTLHLRQYVCRLIYARDGLILAIWSNAHSENTQDCMYLSALCTLHVYIKCVILFHAHYSANDKSFI